MVFRYGQSVKTMTVTEAAESFATVLDELERNQEEVTVMRGKHPVARIVPEPSRANALAVFGDLYGILDQKTGAALAKAVRDVRHRKNQKLNALRNPWAS
jgi:antitoxin (DNA-binding transcriptional repressor) of toxin-antitoxin stability system